MTAIDAAAFVEARTGHPWTAKVAAAPGKWDAVVLAEAAALQGVEPRLARPTPAPPPHPGVPVLDEWTYVTERRLVADTLALMAKLPHDVDAVAAISRSGLLPGSLVAYHRHLPLYTVSRQTGVNDPGHGGRMEALVAGVRLPSREHRHVLLIDDTAAHGREMTECRPIVEAHFAGATITRAVVYCHPRATHAVDACAAIYPGLHYLSYNYLNSGHGEAVALDFDGILGRDFTAAECASMESYRAAMASIEPLSLPRRLEVPLVVTARPECCRDLTEAWLGRWGVRVRRLVMWDGDPHPPAAKVAPWKARHLRASGIGLFVESDPWQAAEINRLTGRVVICPQAEKVFPPFAKPRVPLGSKPGR